MTDPGSGMDVAIGDDLACVSSSRSRPFISDVKPQPCLETGVTSGGIALAVLFV
jgi:hypothetical protein